MSRTSSTPRWVKIAGVITVVVLALVVILLIVGGPHSPRRHAAPTVAVGLGSLEYDLRR